MSSKGKSSRDTITVRRGRMDSIDVYDVTDQELEALKRGGDGGIYLNFALAFFSIAVSFIIALETTSITSDRQFFVFALVAAGALLGAVILGLIWVVSRNSTKDIVLIIKSRMSYDQNPDKNESETDAVDRS